MIYFQTILLALIQGITEFVPVSSSGHLILGHVFLQTEVLNSLAFDVALHVGTLISLIIYFYRDLAKYAKAFFTGRMKSLRECTTNEKLARMIIASIIPAGIIGYFFEDVIDVVLRSPFVVVGMLVVGALLFFLVERYGKQSQQAQDLTWRSLSVIACAQALALIPGTSRSGITITAGMAMRLSREAAARFSFLMSVPIIFLAGVKKTIDLLVYGGGGTSWEYYLLGMLVAAISGYVAITWMLSFVQKHSLSWFGWYRIVLAGVVFSILVL